MKNNIGELDRVVRIILAIVIIASGLTFSIWLVPIGIIILVTGIIGWCPLYSLLKISTNKNFDQEQPQN